MFCSIFRGEEGYSSQTGAASKKVNSSVQGTTNFKLETIKDHEISKAHRSNSLKVQNRDKPVQETPDNVAFSHAFLFLFVSPGPEPLHYMASLVLP